MRHYDPRLLPVRTCATTRRRLTAVVASTVCFLPLAVCSAEPPPDFLRQIRPILAENCFACHGPDAQARQAGLRLDQAETARQRLESGTSAIVSGNVEASELIRRIDSSDAALMMPPPETHKQLSETAKGLLRAWIAAGAPYAVHWAYQAPRRPALPAVSRADWACNAIDTFVLARLEEAGIAPSPRAPRETLLRRWSLDLLGLLPTTEDMAAFFDDQSADAEDRALDRLLASPHLGEKLAQDWLDLARFGDTSGYQDDNDRPNSPYRDAVIRAFNQDMPFDQFTIESLAGDLLPEPTITQKVLSGFNRLHRYNEEGGSDPEEFRVVYAVDRTNTMAATWMGVSLGCAQCHDHKYDPFSQVEYYQLLAFFNSLKGEITISKGPANPPQIRVPSPLDQQRLDDLTQRLSALDARIGVRESQTAEAFEKWLLQPPRTSPEPLTKTGAIGGTVARTTRRAYYADTELEEPLDLRSTLRSAGRVVVVRSVNNAVEVGHFSRQGSKGFPGIGWSVAEGPRFFAFVTLENGSVVYSPALSGELGVEYTWQCNFDPANGRLVFELNREGKPAGNATYVLTPEQRASQLSFEAFGVAFRGINDADSPIEFYLDDLEYTVASHGQPRRQSFDKDPQWTGEDNQTDGHRFGYVPSATTQAPDGLSPVQLLNLPAEQRTPEQLIRLRQHFLREYAPDLRQLQDERSTLEQQRKTLEQAMPLALVWEEMEMPRPTHLLTRGDYQQVGKEVQRNVPAIFPPLPADAPRDRLTLARWLVQTDHPLTARVAVNRLWKQVFGAGLVRTPDDFGTRGELPTHPELLDWLAVDFRANDRDAAWDIKRLLRQLVLSSSYRQSSAVTEMLRERDPHNRLLARGARFRLSAEEVRDMALTASGLLTRQLGGRSVFPYQPDHFYRDKEDDPNEWKWPLETGGDLYRRGLYTFIRRTSPYPAFQTFDVAGRGECLVARARTNTPLQALVTLNDPVFMEAARVLAERILQESAPSLDERLQFLVRCVLARDPTPAESAILQSLYRSEWERFHSDPTAASQVRLHGKAPQARLLDDAEVATWTAVANAVLNLDEAITRE